MNISRFSYREKVDAVQRTEYGEAIEQVAYDFAISPATLSLWRREMLKDSLDRNINVSKVTARSCAKYDLKRMESKEISAQDICDKLCCPISTFYRKKADGTLWQLYCQHNTER